MWTDENRGRYDRSQLRYPSDLTDAEWVHVAPVIPPARRGGNRRHVDERELVNGLMYILSTGGTVRLNNTRSHPARRSSNRRRSGG
jgi:transposase